MKNDEINDSDLLKQQIEVELEKCPSPEICNKIKNYNEKLFCISYVHGLVTKEGFSISEAIGSLDAFLGELRN